MVATFRIAVDVGGLLTNDVPQIEALFPTLSHSVRRLAEGAHHQWVRYAMGEQLPDGQIINPRSGTYGRSIQLRQLGPFSAEVYSNLPYAQSIEQGMPARDLKRMLDHSLKVRLTKDGRRYLIIPFRHNAPTSVLGNQMPKEVADWWQDTGRQPSAIIGTYRRVSGTGAYDTKTRQLITVPGRTYSWGSRLTKADLEGLGITGQAARRLEGMVNFRKPNARGGAAHSKYLTFRVMMEGSKGWQAKAVEGKWPARTVAEQFGSIAEEVFRKAAEEDIRRVLAAGQARP